MQGIKKFSYHLKDLPQEKRKYILERFFANFDKAPADENAERESGYVRTVKVLNIIGTDDPVYTYESIDEWNLKVTLTL